MKLLSAMGLAIMFAASSAYAAPQLRMLDEQIADAPSQQAPDNGATPGTGPSPSKKLSQSKGVIHPPPTHDPSVVTPPGNSAGKVIPPPGTPGGDENVQPK